MRASPARLAWQALLKRPTAVFGGVVLLVIAALALLAPWVAPFDPLIAWSLAPPVPAASRPPTVTVVEPAGR